MSAPPVNPKLSTDQLTAFDHDALENYGIRNEVIRILGEVVSRQDFTFMDVGGGNGKFTDFILASFPQAKGVVVENSDYMIGLNRPNERKRVVSQDAFTLEKIGEKCDVIFCNFLLHHLVSNAYSLTRKGQVGFLASLPKLLNPNGKVFIIEELKDGFICDRLSVWLIYRLTISRILAPLMRRFGANTAGVGVAFFSRKMLEGFLRDAHFVLGAGRACRERPSWLQRIVLWMSWQESGAILTASPVSENTRVP